MTSDSPSISIIIDTFNHAAYLPQAIESVLAQDAKLDEAEIIVVDDGSTDETPALMERFEGVRYIRKANGGQASAFNAGMKEARGELLFFLNGDDWWTPNKLRT